MTYAEWIVLVEKIVHQYNEGAITSREAFNAIIARAYEVKAVDYDVEMQ